MGSREEEKRRRNREGVDEHMAESFTLKADTKMILNGHQKKHKKFTRITCGKVKIRKKR